MGQVFAYVIAVIFTLPVCALFLLFVAADFVGTKEYNHANRIMAVITDHKGVQETSNYGRRAKPTAYYVYAVRFIADGRT